MIYRQIHCRIWNDDKFPFMNDDAKLVLMHLITTPYGNSLGIFKLSLNAMADEMRWDVSRYRDAISVLIDHGMIQLDEKNLVVWISKFLKYNTPTSPNTGKRWAVAIQELPQSDLIKEWLISVVKNEYGIPDGILHAILDAISTASPIHRSWIREHRSRRKDPPKVPLNGDGISFDVFWEAYPNRAGGKGGKVIPEKKWSSMTEEEKKSCLESLDKYKKCDDWIKENGKYIPLPSTFLNQKRWEGAPLLAGQTKPEGYWE